ncbi:MAG TPA: AAA family ATPase [Mucilaginibacter sp.]|nr:AAA family ATPase [Mucilaginibacter sp.]
MISRGELLDIYFNKDGTDINKYPFSLPFFRNLDGFKIHPKVTFFVGENGTGKSTLLEAIAVASGFNPEGGSSNFNFNTRESHSVLHQHIRTSRGVRRRTDGYFLRSESFFNVSTEIEKLDSDPDSGGPPIIDAYGGVSLHEQSHGETFWSVFSHRFRGNGFYILDEPEAALSPNRQMAMLLKINELVATNSQFIIATHSPILIAYPDALIYEFSKTGVQVKTYAETELFQTYRDFFKDPDYMVNRLLNS